MRSQALERSLWREATIPSKKLLQSMSYPDSDVVAPAKYRCRMFHRPFHPLTLKRRA